MPLTEKQFEECLVLYGTDLENWPDELIADAMMQQYMPAMNSLLIEQQYFDEMLLNNRRFESASSDLAERIIYAARTTRKSPRITMKEWIQELLASVLPKPTFALATVLTLGIIIGMAIPLKTVSDTAMQAYYEDEGTTL